MLTLLLKTEGCTSLKLWDLRTEGDLTAARLKDIAVSAVTLDEAKRTFGRSTWRYFIYAGNKLAERQARGYLNAAEHHTDYIFNFVSKEDRARYLDFVFAALRGDLADSARLLTVAAVAWQGRSRRA